MVRRNEHTPLRLTEHEWCSEKIAGTCGRAHCVLRRGHLGLVEPRPHSRLERTRTHHGRWEELRRRLVAFTDTEGPNAHPGAGRNAAAGTILRAPARAPRRRRGQQAHPRASAPTTPRAC